MKKSKLKNKNGITLIALIITIIIMLILVAVSINILIKSDLFGAAQKAADKTKTAYEEEGKLGEIEIDGVKYNSVDEYINQSQCTHEWGEWEVIKAANCSETGLKRRTCTKCGKVEEEEIAKNTSHIIEDGKCTKCGGTYELQIGATIDYKEYIDPSTGEAFTEFTEANGLSYTSTKEKNGYTDTTYTISEPAEGETGIEWVVIGEEDGKIKIKTKNIVQPSTGGYTSGSFTYLRFYGQTGYANFVNELNSIGAIYGKGKYADSGRSMKAEDLGYGELTREASYIYAKHKSNGKIYRYAATATEDDIANETSTAGGYYTTFKYIAMDADPNIKEGDEGACEWKELSEAGDYVRMYQYKYTGSQTLSTTIAKADTYYWLASRDLYCNSGYVNLGAQLVDIEGDHLCQFLCSSYGDTLGSLGVCPIVSLTSDIQLEYNSETNSYTIID